MNYTVRIELHDNMFYNFQVLHKAMQKEGFSRLIVSTLGITYHLPRATYNISTLSSSEDVLKKAHRAVSITGKTAEILVSEVQRSNWSGLTIAK